MLDVQEPPTESATYSTSLRDFSSWPDISPMCWRSPKQSSAPEGSSNAMTGTTLSLLPCFALCLLLTVDLLNELWDITGGSAGVLNNHAEYPNVRDEDMGGENAIVKSVEGGETDDDHESDSHNYESDGLETGEHDDEDDDMDDWSVEAAGTRTEGSEYDDGSSQHLEDDENESAPPPEHTEQIKPKCSDLQWLSKRQEEMFKFLIQSSGDLLALAKIAPGNDAAREEYRRMIIDCDLQAIHTQVNESWVSPFELMAEEKRKRGVLDASADHADWFSSPQFCAWFDEVVRRQGVQSMISALRELIGVHAAAPGLSPYM
jgi:hypothetical protein